MSFDKKDIDQVSINYAKSLKILCVLTLGDKGSLIIEGDKVAEIKSEPVTKVVDTTGAGDLFAAGFLFGAANEKTNEESARYASIAAAEIISHYGARPKIKLSSII